MATTTPNVCRKSHKRQKRIDLDVCLACESVIMFKSYVSRLHISERRRAINVEWRASNIILFESNVCVCVCIYGCSVLIILCARAHLVLFLLLHRMTSEGIPEGLFFFFGFFFAFERGSKCTHSKCENLESKSFEKKYILYYHHWNNKYKISKK